MKNYDNRAEFTITQNEKNLPIYRVGVNEKKVSVSFDAAWGANQTEKILNTLDKYNVKTTFFLVGFWVEEYPELAKMIVEQGHEIGNHSTTHPEMSKLSEDRIREELRITHDVIKRITGFEANLFRPPFGDYNNLLINVCEDIGYKVIQWDVDSLDWKDLSSSAIADRVLNNLELGSIVLFHNNGKNTPEALELILKDLKEKDYSVVPISELIFEEDYYIDHRGEQRKN